MDILIFILGFLFLFGLVIYFSIIFRWRENKKQSSEIETINMKFFDNLEVSTSRFGKYKIIIGFATKAKLFYNEKLIIIVAKKNSFSLVQSELPIKFDKENNIIPEKIKMNEWNSIIIETQNYSTSVGLSRVECLIETQNKEQKLELYNQLKNWCRYS
ncbi:MAG: hypothetical protein IPO21_18160 [Bacteroidales bacterium]|nr:hypothetical protein [Bacteroidales bacterium]